jgi:hypothetical protein
MTVVVKTPKKTGARVRQKIQKILGGGGLPKFFFFFFFFFYSGRTRFFGGPLSRVWGTVFHSFTGEKSKSTFQNEHPLGT